MKQYDHLDRLPALFGTRPEYNVRENRVGVHDAGGAPARSRNSWQKKHLANNRAVQNPRNSELDRAFSPARGVRFSTTYSSPRSAQNWRFSSLSPSSFTA